MKAEEQQIIVAVSACLLGDQVRYDGGHKRDRNITDHLGKHFVLLAICPEVECGLPTPREVMRLEGDPAAPSLVTIRTRLDLTEQMNGYCAVKVDELTATAVCGFVFKERSPSCGLSEVRVLRPGIEEQSGRGLFAAAVARRLPLVPLAEAEELGTPEKRDDFIERVYAYCRLAGTLSCGSST